MQPMALALVKAVTQSKKPDLLVKAFLRDVLFFCFCLVGLICSIPWSKGNGHFASSFRKPINRKNRIIT
jgi:hypothetical protein